MELSVSRMAAAVGISEQAVRDYEAAGLLPPVPRRENGYRVFSERHLAALMVVRALKEAGYSRAEMTTTMDALHRGSPSEALALIDEHHGEIRDRRSTLLSAVLHREESALGTCRADADEDATLSIGEAATRLGITVAALRFWESMGVIQVGRDPSNGYRRFTESDLERIAGIMRMRALGVPWDAIRASQAADQDGVSGLDAVWELDRQSWVNARATTLVCAYATVCQGDGGDASVRAFLDTLNDAGGRAHVSAVAEASCCLHPKER